MSASVFAYRGVSTDGGGVRGSIEAADRAEAYRKLTAQGVTPTKLSASNPQQSRASLFSRSGVKAEQIASVTQQLAVLLSAGLPVTDAILSIAEQEPAGRLRQALVSVARSVQSGSTITESLRPHVSIFGEIYIETVHAAEQTGNVTTVLEHLARSVQDGMELRRTVRGALMYPAAVLVAIGLAVAFLLVFVVPKFAHMFMDRGVELPALTSALLVFGESVKSFWYAYLGVIGGAVFTLRSVWASPRGRLAIDGALHRVPLLRDILVDVAVARFTSVLGIALRSGLGLIESLEMASRASGRPTLRRDIDRAVASIRGGSRLRDGVHASDYLPAFAKQLLSAGETSGRVPEMCRIASEHFSSRAMHLAKNAATVLEPALIALLTGVVLVVALAIFMPMWNMISLVG
ncbi:MAG: type II secretion system F family protein [Planctomycetota bacterium]